MSMFEKAEQEYQDLLSRKTIIENDKAKIEQLIAELDEKKNDTLSKTWTKVNKDFGSIFSTLLPGATAKLDKESDSVLDGLAIKVALGDVWKESLSELSGGQRSLIALSLVLALLLYKPAPMYILDEVDAALDLSHTQNIGAMIRTHFKHSQFIVVSLKEGMFNNANVLFRTKFVDGVSTVVSTARPPARAQPTRMQSAASCAIGTVRCPARHCALAASLFFSLGRGLTPLFFDRAVTQHRQGVLGRAGRFDLVSQGGST